MAQRDVVYHVIPGALNPRDVPRYVNAPPPTIVPSGLVTCDGDAGSISITWAHQDLVCVPEWLPRRSYRASRFDA